MERQPIDLRRRGSTSPGSQQLNHTTGKPMANKLQPQRVIDRAPSFGLRKDCLLRSKQMRDVDMEQTSIYVAVHGA